MQALGPAPDYLDATEKAVWTDIASDLPWLGKSDRCILAIATRLMTRLRTDPAMGVNAIAQLRMCLSSLGATPADRSKVSVPDDPDDDPAAEFLC